MTRLFTRKGTSIESHLSVEDKALLVQIPDLLSDVTVGDPAHPVLNRVGYTKDEAAEAEYRELVDSQLDTDRREDLRALLRFTQGSTVVDDADAKAALRSINAARLALAARAGILDNPDGWETRISEDATLAAIAWLGYLQGELLAVLIE